MDRNTPARFLDTAYDAYKSNPTATNQILQAAAQGAPVGLRGLAAAAAQQSQQQAQQAMAALQQQGAQPNVIQKLATQGIMSQMDTGLPIAQPMPEEAPQMMATGGLVAFADGGNVLPPDVIEAIQSHFAEGGAVHGYAEGETVLGDIIRDLKWRQLQGVANEEELARLSDLIRRQHLSASMIEGLSEAAAPKPDIGLTGPSPSRVLEESDRLGEIIRRERTARPMLEGLERGAGYQPSFKPEPTLSMVEKLEKGAVPYESTARAPVSEGMEKLAQAAEYSPEAVKKAAWTGGEGFRGFKMPDVKVPEPLKKFGRLIEKNPELLMLTDPRVRALAGLHSGAGKMLTGFGGEGAGAEEVLSGLASLREEGAFPLSVRELLPKFAEGGDVRGYATGEEILRKLTGPQASFGQRAFGGLLNLLSSPDEPNRAITREELETRKARPEAETYGKEGEAFKGAGLDISESPAPTPKAEVHPEGKKVTPEFKKVVLDTSSTATGTPTTSTTSSSLTSGESMGIPTGAGGLEGLRDMMMELRGRKTMTPAVSKELEDLRSSARTSTILQSLLGGLGAGLSSPYGGRFALGKAALGSLAGYEKGISSEEEIGRKAFDVLRGYEDAPAEEQATAMDKILGITSKAAELQSEERRAMLKPSFEDKFALERWKEQQKLLHPEVHGGALAPRGTLTQGDLLQADLKANQETEAWAKAQAELPPFKAPTAEEKAAYKANLLRTAIASATGQTSGLGANIAAGQAGGLGGRPPIID